MMKIITCYQTKNPCYKKAQAANQVGIVVHSTGANNPNLKRYVDCPERLGTNTNGNTWNRENAETMVHAFIGKDADGKVIVCNTLPYTYACWGVGRGPKGSYNYDPTAHIQFELCEDGLQDTAYFKECMEVAAEYCAYLCKSFGWDYTVICSHAEAHKRGYGSNHADIDHWLRNFGWTMDTFRAAVKMKMEGEAVTTYTVKAGDTLIKIAKQFGTTADELAAYNNIENPSLIRPGQVIKIPGADTSTPSPAPSPNKNPYSEPDYLVKKGSSGDGVKWVQWQLVNVKGAKIAVDGSYGDETEIAVKYWQMQAGLKVDAIVGPDTRKALK